MEERFEKSKLTPEKVVEILKKKGTSLSTDEAETMLKFIKS
ncbi:hypothetical protein QFZ37_003208 [Chryseobacterium ginsenosidimutans]|nr:hypothetical protein [Chryseobacterium ginsenosidimutans]MDQ0594839.1 hypothetical protein [Chryseobacterium ginsenosidimutans]